MALHPNTASLVRESIAEYIHVADWCIKYVKSASWGPGHDAGGCLGYPGAAMLFAIADSIGSYYEGNSDAEFMVDGKPKKITKDGAQHFYVLNSEYYKLDLTGKQIETLYTKYRNPLVHNAALVPNLGLCLNPTSSDILIKRGSSELWLNLGPFLNKSKQAVALFLDRAESIIPGSRQEKNIRKKGARG